LLALPSDRDAQPLHSFPTRRSSDLVAALVAATAAALYGTLLHGEPALEPGARGVVLALPVLYALAEMSVIHVYVRAEASSFSLRSEEHTSELQSRENLVCRLLLEKK